MSKMHFLVTNFPISSSAGGFPSPAPLNLQYWRLEVPWFGQIVVFEADYDEIELQNIVRRHFSDVITITSSRNVTKTFQFGPLPIKISDYASGLGL